MMMINQAAVAADAVSDQSLIYVVYPGNPIDIMTFDF